MRSDCTARRRRIPTGWLSPVLGLFYARTMAPGCATLSGTGHAADRDMLASSDGITRARRGGRRPDGTRRIGADVPELILDGRGLAVLRGDITLVPADAIVNAANSGLIPGGGVDHAIHAAGGPTILADLRARYGDDSHRNCPTGAAVVTIARHSRCRTTSWSRRRSGLAGRPPRRAGAPCVGVSRIAGPRGRTRCEDHHLPRDQLRDLRLPTGGRGAPGARDGEGLPGGRAADHDPTGDVRALLRRGPRGVRHRACAPRPEVKPASCNTVPAETITGPSVRRDCRTLMKQ